LPAGAILPDSFRRQVFTSEEADSVACLVGSAKCELHPLDMNGDGKVEVLASEGAGFRVFRQEAGGRWAAVGAYVTTGCATPPGTHPKGELRTIPPLFGDLEVAGQRLRFNQDQTCRFASGVYSERTAPASMTKPGGLGPAFAP